MCFKRKSKWYWKLVQRVQLEYLSGGYWEPERLYKDLVAFFPHDWPKFDSWHHNWSISTTMSDLNHRVNHNRVLQGVVPKPK